MDEVVIIYSNTSNYGQVVHYQDQIEGVGTLINWEPDLRKTPHQNETAKRNFALAVAKSMGFTHFVMMDCDEIYEPADFSKMKGLCEWWFGVVCPLKVYIKEPTLQCKDHTLVPAIHRLTAELKFEFGNKTYPYAYDTDGHAHIDPTRRLNVKEGIALSAFPMHHFSHVRKDIHLKMDNSSARDSLKKSTLLADYQDARPGYYSQFYRDTLVEVPNRFDIQI